MFVFVRTEAVTVRRCAALLSWLKRVMPLMGLAIVTEGCKIVMKPATEGVRKLCVHAYVGTVVCLWLLLGFNILFHPLLSSLQFLSFLLPSCLQALNSSSRALWMPTIRKLEKRPLLTPLLSTFPHSSLGRSVDHCFCNLCAHIYR